MKIKDNQQKIKKRIILTSLVILPLLVGSLLTFSYANKSWPFKDMGDNSQQGSGSDKNSPGNANGENDSEKAEGNQPTKGQDPDNSQDDKTNETNNNSSSATRKRSIDVGVSYANVSDDKLEIRAFTNGVVESTGTCTAEASKGTAKVTASSEAFIDASSSICNPIYIPTSQLQSGEWNVVVTYSSPTASGKSDISKVTVP